MRESVASPSAAHPPFEALPRLVPPKDRVVLSKIVRCAIVQPSYIPWRGYFDLIRRVDVFVFYDDVQYDRRGWRNRNRIKTAQGSRWLTIPVHARGAQTDHLPINSVRMVDSDWPRRHLDALRRSYAAAPYFGRYADWLEHIYAAPPPLLADFTIALTRDIAATLALEARFLRSSELGVTGAKTARLLAVLRAVGATTYLSGPSARSYIEEEQFARAGIELEWMEYHYPEYPQLHPPFDPQVSILDLLFMTGDRAGEYIGG